MSCPGDQVVILLPDNSWEEVEECLEAVIRKDGDRENNYLMDMMGIKVSDQDERSIFLGNFEENHINMGVRVVSEESNKKENGNLDKSENTCPFCRETFISTKRMQCHVSITHDQQSKYQVTENEYNGHHICSFCGCSFTKTREFNKHITTEHATIATLTRKCKECEKHFNDKKSFTRHMQSQHAITETFTCEVCQKQFVSTSKRILKRHMRNYHANGPLYKCEICQKEFLKESTFYEHRSCHNTIIICDLCGKDLPAKNI